MGRMNQVKSLVFVEELRFMHGLPQLDWVDCNPAARADEADELQLPGAGVGMLWEQASTCAFY